MPKHFDKNKKLTFRIVDSPMGIGKSSSLLEYLHFGAFYFNDDSIQSLRRTGIFNDETIKSFHKSDCAWHAFFDEIPSLFRGVIGGAQRPDSFDGVTRFGTADVLLMQQGFTNIAC